MNLFSALCSITGFDIESIAREMPMWPRDMIDAVLPKDTKTFRKRLAEAWAEGYERRSQVHNWKKGGIVMVPDPIPVNPYVDHEEL